VSDMIPLSTGGGAGEESGTKLVGRGKKAAALDVVVLAVGAGGVKVEMTMSVIEAEWGR